MTKRVFIVHRWDGSPEEPLYQSLASELEKKDYEVEILEMPNPEEPTIEEWTDFLKEQCKNPNENTHFIGHSIGCQAVLRYVETLHTKVGNIVLIAPWTTLEGIEEEGEEVVAIAKPWIETPLKFDRIKTKAKKFSCIFSDNDPYVSEDNYEIFQEGLDANITIESEQGHFTEDDGVTECKAAIEELTGQTTTNP